MPPPLVLAHSLLPLLTENWVPPPGALWLPAMKLPVSGAVGVGQVAAAVAEAWMNCIAGVGVPAVACRSNAYPQTKICLPAADPTSGAAVAVAKFIVAKLLATPGAWHGSVVGCATATVACATTPTVGIELTATAGVFTK